MNIIVLKAHDISAQDAIEMRLFDNMRTPIDQSIFPIVVEQYQHDARFYVEIEFGNKGVTSVSKEVSLPCIFLCFHV